MQLVSYITLLFIVLCLYMSFFFLIIFFKNRKKLYKDPKSKRTPKLSVIIPAWNEERSIATTIKAIKRTIYPNLVEILVVNDGSTDKTVEIAKQFSKVKIINKNHSGKADCVNHGLKIAKGELIAIVDADSSPAKDAFSKIVPYFEDKKVGAVTSSVLAKRPKGILQGMQHIEYTIASWGRKLLEYVNAVYVTPGPLSIYRKSILLKIGGFDSDNLTEDLEITWHLLSEGYKVKMCMSAKTHTIVHKKLKSWWNQRLRWNTGALQTMNKYRSSILRKGSGVFGLFVTPLVISFYVMSVFGFLLLSYLMWRNIFGYFLYIKNATIAQINPFNFQISFLPDIFNLFLMFLLLLAVVYVFIGLDTLKEREKGIKPILASFFYLMVYLSIFPIILLQSFIRFATNKNTW